MGVTIHYRGKLKSPSLIEPLMEEVADICQSKNWKYNLFNGKKDFDELLMSPEETDEWENADPDEQPILQTQLPDDVLLAVPPVTIPARLGLLPNVCPQEIAVSQPLVETPSKTVGWVQPSANHFTRTA